MTTHDYYPAEAMAFCFNFPFPGGDELLGADAITKAAELASLTEAWDDAWIVNKGAQWLVQSLHGVSGTPWLVPLHGCFLTCDNMCLKLVYGKTDLGKSSKRGHAAAGSNSLFTRISSLLQAFCILDVSRCLC